VPPDPGPRWYETPLWFVAQIAVYVVLWAAVSVIAPRDLGPAGRAVMSLVILGALVVGGAAVRGRLRRRDA
jgi:hypothetical protein